MESIHRRTIDPEVRRLEKKALRAQNEKDLRTGKLSGEDINRRNNFLSAFDARNSIIQSWEAAS